MATTTHLGITLVDQSQAQKEVTVNEALTRLDAILNIGAKSRSTSTPPGSPASGDLYIVGASPTGAWSGQAAMMAYFDQVWQFITPDEGMTLWVNDEDLIYSYNGSVWTANILGNLRTIDAQTGTTYTLAAADAGKNVELNNASAITLTLPNSLPVGFYCGIAQTGAGQVTLSAASGATLHNRSGFTKTAGQWAVLNLYVTANSGGAAAVYIMSGDGA